MYGPVNVKFCIFVPHRAFIL